MPRIVERAVLRTAGDLVQDERAPHRAGDAEGHVEPEHPVPADGDQGATEDRADDQADGGHHRVGAHGQTELLLGEGVGDDRRRIGEQERAAHALQDAPQDELSPAAREAGAERRRGEEQKAADVGLLAPELIRQPARAEHEHGRGDHVDEDHPHELEQAGVQAALEVGQGDDQRARVDRRQEHAQRGAGQGPPLVGVVVGVDPDDAGIAARWPELGPLTRATTFSGLKSDSYVSVRIAPGRNDHSAWPWAGRWRCGRPGRPGLRSRTQATVARITNAAIRAAPSKASPPRRR